MLVGNPNTGKSTVFNRLTGFRQRVGNYPGVTVEKHSGMLAVDDPAVQIELIDLPGAYSLAAGAEDETIVAELLLARQAQAVRPDLIVCILDASNLRRNLFFATQVLELGVPVIVALNMLDVTRRRGLEIDIDALAEELGTLVVPVVATRGEGIDKLKTAIAESIDLVAPTRCPSFPDCVCAEVDGLCQSLGLSGSLEQCAGQRSEALQSLLSPGGYHETRLVERCGRGLAEELIERRGRITAAGESLVEVEARVRYAWIDRVVERVVRTNSPPGPSKTQRADALLTHRIFGTAILAAIMLFCFQAIYTWAGPLMDVIDGAFVSLASGVSALLPEGPLQSLLADGIIAGVGAVLIFLPQILVLFLFIAILEDCGYMARAAFLLDRWMSLVGLGGKAFIPLLSSYACAIPGILATRTIENRSDRFVTILIAPLMSCSARLPVYVLLISAFVPPIMLAGGWVSLQAVTLLGMYLVGTLVAIGVAFVLKRTAFRGPAQSFLMELPTYRWPVPRVVLYRAYEQGKEFVVTAGTIIFAVTVVIWALAYYPRPQTIATNHDAMRAQADAEYANAVAASAEKVGAEGLREPERKPEVAAALAAIRAEEASFESEVLAAEIEASSEEWAEVRRAADAKMSAIAEKYGDDGMAALELFRAETKLAEQLTEIDHLEEGAYFRQSFLAHMGRWIEPVVRPLGWDWRIGTAVLASFPAREVIIATMGTIYNLGGEQDETSQLLREKLHRAKWPSGERIFTLPVALSIMVFFALCCQCGATLAVIRRETQSWRWPVITFVYMTTLAYVGALATFQIATRLAA